MVIIVIIAQEVYCIFPYCTHTSAAMAVAYTQDEIDKWPRQISIGTAYAFENNNAYLYDLIKWNDEAVYVCDKGSKYSRQGEQLILRYTVCHDDNGAIESMAWTAYDGGLLHDGSQFACRQAVFRIQNEKITYPGTYTWQQNVRATPRSNCSETPEWHGGLSAETRVTA